MALGLDKAIALILQDGDPARSIDGLATLRDFWWENADSSKRHIFVGEEPDHPDDAVTVLLEAGASPVGGGAPNALLRRPSFTVRSRSEAYEDSMEIAHQVHELLDYFEGTSNSVPIARILADFEPLPLGRDSEDRGGRFVFSQTFRSVTKRFAPS